MFLITWYVLNSFEGKIEADPPQKKIIGVWSLIKT